ncbi:MAG: hypothetical protein JKY37_00155 [Nannocystaceae bacterium]|nr:hypothetical protein [Nannocystaceae bacterium]
MGCEVALNSYANCTSCGLEPTSYFLTPVASASMSPDDKWPDPETLAVRSGTDEYTGWLGFDIGSISVPEGAWPFLGFISLRMTDEPNNPNNVPGIVFSHSDANDWDSDAVQPGEIVSAGSFSNGQWNLTEGNYTPADWNLAQLNLASNAANWWPQDLQDGWLTLGVEENSTEERSVHFWGATDGEFDPQLQLVFCQ